MIHVRPLHDRQLQPHWFLSELIGSEMAVRLGIDNTPGPRQLHHVETVLAPGMQRVRELLGVPVLVSSGYRCAALNTAIHGSPNSAHMEGLAADFTAPGFGDPLRVARAIAASTIEYGQCIYEGAGSAAPWIHLSFAPPGRVGRRELLTARFERGGRTRYSTGLA